MASYVPGRTMGDRVRTGTEQDRKRINLELDRDVRYWMKTLGIDEDELRSLVKIHGHSATIIREMLERQRSAA
jgi:hypothetical protein